MLTYCLSLDAFAAGVPAEARLFKAGKNETTKGVFIFDAASAKSVLKRAEVWKNNFSFDYDHKSLKPDAPTEAGRAAGWYELELRDGELWAVNIRWTPAMAEFIKNKEFRYLSPAFKVDDDNRIVEFVNCAVTNLPATHDQIPLVAAKAVPFHPYPVDSADAWDAKAAIARIQAWASSDHSGQLTTINWAKYGLAFAWIDARFSTHTFEAFKLPHHDIVNGNIVTSRAGVIAAGTALSARGLDIPTTDLAGVRKHLEGHYQQLGMRPPWQKETNMTLEEILAALANDPEAVKKLSALLPKQEVKKLAKGKEKAADDNDVDENDEELDDDDSDDEEMSKAKKAKKMKAKKASKAECAVDAAFLTTLTGSSDVEEQKGILAAFKASQTKVEALTKSVDGMLEEKDKAARLSLIEKGIADGKIAPAQKDALAELSLKALTAFIEKAPKLVVTSTETTLAPEPKVSEIHLTSVEREIAANILSGMKDENGKFLTPEQAELKYKTTKAANRGVIRTADLS